MFYQFLLDRYLVESQILSSCCYGLFWGNPDTLVLNSSIGGANMNLALKLSLGRAKDSLMDNFLHTCCDSPRDKRLLRCDREKIQKI